MKRSTKIRICHEGLQMLFYPAAPTLSRQTLTYTAAVIRHTASQPQAAATVGGLPICAAV